MHSGVFLAREKSGFVYFKLPLDKKGERWYKSYQYL